MAVFPKHPTDFKQSARPSDVQEDLEQKQKFVHMTTASVNGLIARLFVPTVVTMLITAMYNLVDTFFVGQLGTSAISAVGTIFSVMAAFQTIGFGFGHGSGNYVSRQLGARHVEEAQTMANVGFFSSFLTGLVISAIGLLCLSPLVRILGVTDTIFPYAKDYLFFILLGAPFFSSSLTLNNLLRLQGNARFAMWGIAIGAILNCIMDPIFIFGLDMGIRGAGLSSCLSQIVSFVILLWGNEHSDAVKLRPLKFRPTRQRYLSILQGGMPSVGRQGMRCVGTIVLNHVLAFFGDEVYAAITIVIRVGNFLFALAIGIGQGFQPVCGFNYGAGMFHRVRQGFRFTLQVAIGAMIPLCGLLIIFAPTVIGWFTQNEDVRELAVYAMRLQCFTIPLMSMANVSSMLFQNINLFWRAFFIAIGRDGLFFIPLVLLLPFVWSVEGLLWVQPIADVITSLLAMRLLWPVWRQLGCQPTSAPKVG